MHTLVAAVRHRAGLLVALAAVLAWPGTAAALIRPAVTIDGPSSAILSLDGVAMAPDGTGGAVYLKLAQGEPHVFVARFVNGHWQAPERVDTALPFDSSFPAIGAADHGRLVVVWAQSYAQDVNGNHFRAMYSATLMPGASSFDAPIAFDSGLSSPNANGDEASSELDPSLAMSPGGQAYLIYRVITNPCAPICVSGEQGTVYRAGDVFASYRLARYSGETWSVLGDINRNQAFSVRPAAAGNAPEVVIDDAGHGVAAFQEPDSSGFDRIWARRLFGSSIGQILPVSATSLLGQPVTGDADAFSLAGGSAGAAAVAYRQQPAPGSVFTSTHELVASMATPATPLNKGANGFGAAVAVDDGLPGLGLPAVGVQEPGLFDAEFAGAGQLQSAFGDPIGDFASPTPSPAGQGAMSGESAPVVGLGSEGSQISAWPTTDAAGRPLVEVQEAVEQDLTGVPTYTDAHARVAAGVGGPIETLMLGRSESGDALVAFQQGQAGNAQIAGALVQAPPLPFTLTAPVSWVRARRALLTWTRAFDGLSPVRYTVTFDGAARARGLTAQRWKVDPRGLADGSYNVVVTASDDVGQSRLSAVVPLEIDDRPPQVTVTVHGSRVTVRVSDGPMLTSSGVDLLTSWVRFAGARRRRLGLVYTPSVYALASHVFRARGTFAITVHAADAAGNVRTVVRRVSVP